MYIDLKYFMEKSRVQILLLAVTGLLFFKLFLHTHGSAWSTAVNDLLVILVFYYMVVNMRSFVTSKSLSSVSLVGSMLVIGALI